VLFLLLLDEFADEDIFVKTVLFWSNGDVGLRLKSIEWS
jgi:hypothetical protein